MKDMYFFRRLGAFYSADESTGGNNPGGGEKGNLEEPGGDLGDKEEPGAKEDPKSQSLTAETVQKMIQAETDRVRTEYSKRLKQLEEEKDALIKEKMSESEKKDYELSKREKAIRDAEMKLLQSNIEIEATNQLSALDMPIVFKDFVKGDTVEATQQRAKELQKVWKTALDEEVQKRFISGGRSIQTKGTAPGGKSIDMNALIRGAARK